MYDNFVYDTGGFKLAGYIWDVPHPDNVVCIIHGIGEYAGRYDRLAKILNPAGIAVLSIDLPGHGLSAGKRGHAAPRSLVLDDVTEMIRYAEEKMARYSDNALRPQHGREHMPRLQSQR